MLYWIVKIVLTPLIKLTMSVKVEGRNHLPRRGPYILAANHRSFIDSILLPYAVRRRRVTYVAKAEYFESWKTRWFFHGSGQIPIERGDGSAAERSLQSAEKILKAGKIFAIYPEGTRSRDGALGRGKTGVARLSIRTGLPVIPVGIRGTDAVMPIGHKFPRLRHPVLIRFNPPMEPPLTAPDSRIAAREFTDKIMSEIQKSSGYEFAADANGSEREDQ